MSLLLSPVELAGLSLENRVVLSPMCMYEVKKEDGVVTPFHFVHYGARALSKVGLLIIEATAVEADGRITKNDLGLWNDAQQTELTKLVSMLKGFGTKVGIQLSHAGRKVVDAVYPIAPSGIAFNEKYAVPNEMTIEEITRVQASFVESAKRAQASGIDMIELHGAHGYLIDQFLSPIVNQRKDEYGGSLENRYRFVKEIVQEVRKVFTGSLWMRLSLTDYETEDKQNSIAEWQQVGQWLEADGIDCLDISTGGLLDKRPSIPIYEGYQTPFATAMKEAIEIPVATVGLLDNPNLCEHILQTKQADLILQGRAMIGNLNWLADAAVQLHDESFVPYNDSYGRGVKR
jgi:NADPH2 dehydrogenase